MARNKTSFDEFVKEEEQSLWTEEEFRNMTRKDLRLFATWNGKACPLPSAYERQIKERPLNRAAAAIATRVFSTNASRSIASVRPEAHIATHGGSFTYYPETVEMTKLSGETVVRNNAPIPARFGETEQYENLVAFSAFSQVVKVKNGEWKSNVNLDNWLKLCGHSACEINVPGLKSFADTLVAVLAKDPVWDGMSLISRNAVTGEEAMCFVREALGRLDSDLYDYLNTKLVCEVLKTFYKAAGKWAYVTVQRDGKRERLIPEHCYRIKSPSDRVARQIFGVYPACYWYMGGLTPNVQFPASNGDMKSTKENVDRAVEILGSESSTSAILAQMRGYSALTDAFGKRIQWILGAVMGLWSQNRNVAVKLTSVGDVPMLVSSLMKWKADITGKRPDKFMTVGGDGTPKLNSLEFCLLLADDRDKAKINVHYYSMLRNQVPQGFVVVYHNETNLPSAHTKGEKPDYDLMSQNLVGEQIRGIRPSDDVIYQENDYVVYTAVYGAVPFYQDAQVQRQLQNRTVEVKPWDRPVKVYSWGSAARFHGVMSNLSSICLVGWGLEKVSGKYPEGSSRTNHWVTLPLTVVATQSDWYKKVVVDARMQPFTFLNPISRYCPISNLPLLSKAGLTFAQSQVQTEDGELIGNITRVNRGEEEVVSDFLPDTMLLNYLHKEEKKVEEGEKIIEKTSGFPPKIVSTAPVKQEDQVFVEETEIADFLDDGDY